MPAKNKDEEKKSTIARNFLFWEVSYRKIKNIGMKSPHYFSFSAKGDKQAGFIENLKEYLVHRKHPIAEIAPDGPLHNFNDVTLQTTLEHQGFQIKKVGFFAMPKRFPPELQLDGSEYVGAIACKPK